MKRKEGKGIDKREVGNERREKEEEKGRGEKEGEER